MVQTLSRPDSATQPRPAAAFYAQARGAAIQIIEQLQQPGIDLDPLEVCRYSAALYEREVFDTETLAALDACGCGLLLWQTAVGIEVGELRAHQ